MAARPKYKIAFQREFYHKPGRYLLKKLLTGADISKGEEIRLLPGKIKPG
jgi:hypothetical protein